MKFFLLLLFVAVLVVGAVVVFGGENLDAATDSGSRAIHWRRYGRALYRH